MGSVRSLWRHSRLPRTGRAHHLGGCNLLGCRLKNQTKNAQSRAQKTFIKTLNDALTGGVSSLVDADMNEASTRLQALQTQQQLGVQSISIANQNAQMILKLFQ